MKNVIALSVLIVCAYAVPAFAQNKVIFDNQAGETALVKLIGPTQTEVDVPNGAKVAADAAAGRYVIKVRYGTPGNYRYTKGDEFTVTETVTARSETTITLHKVAVGNYDTAPISAEEFMGGSRSTSKAVSAVSSDENAWTTNFPAFLARVGHLIGAKPTWPTEGRFGVLAAKNDKNETIWLIPQQITECPEVTAIQEAFAGKTIAWELQVEKVADGLVHFNKPNLGMSNVLLGQWFGFTAMPSESETLSLLKSNQTVIVNGQLGFNLLEGVTVLFGVGPNQGQLSLGIAVQKATIKAK